MKNPIYDFLMWWGATRLGPGLVCFTVHLSTCYIKPLTFYILLQILKSGNTSSARHAGIDLYRPRIAFPCNARKVLNKLSHRGEVVCFILSGVFILSFPVLF